MSSHPPQQSGRLRTLLARDPSRTTDLEELSSDRPDDAVANKVCALFSRAQARDYIDVDAVLQSGRYTSGELLALAESHDPGFDEAGVRDRTARHQPPASCRVHALRA